MNVGHRRRRRLVGGIAAVSIGVVAILGIVVAESMLVSTAFRLYGNVDAARSALTDVATAVEKSGFSITAEEAASVVDRLAQADAALTLAQDALDHDPLIGLLRAVPSIADQLDAADTLVDAARSLTDRRAAIATELDGYITARDSGSGGDRLAALAGFVAHSRPQTEELAAAVEEADRLIRSLPDDGLVGPLASARDQIAARLDQARPMVDAARTASTALPAIMGVGGERRYLVLALDNAEVRPIGGLIGAFATPSFMDGRLQDLTFRDILSIDRLDQKTYVQPPAPLADHLLDTFTWQVADAGWWPDFDTSVGEVRRMYQIETGEDDFQGVIAFTPEFVDRLLAVVGPVEVPEAGITVQSGETYLVSLEQVEVLNKGEGRKAFLAQFASQVLERLFALPPSEYGAVIAAIDEAGKRRQLQVLFDDPKDQSAIDALGWPGPFTFAPTGDRLAIMEANVAPVSKLNVLLTLDHSLDVRLASDGSASERLVTTYTNHYGPELTPELERVRSTFFDGNLGSYSRRYLVPDAILTAVSSDDADDPITDPDAVESESGSLAIGNYQFVRPGTVRLTTEYVAPDVIEPAASGRGGTYRLDFRKQAGRDTDTINVRVAVPEGMVPASWSEGGLRDGAVVTFATTTEFDRMFEVTFGPA